MSSGNIHAENREWAFESLDALEAFLDDEDFQGDVVQERSAIDRKRTELREGKYRVVFLGEFNVGKSTLINAFLGDEYLPTVLEECTAKITHVVKSAEMKTVVSLTSLAAEDELQVLGDLLSSYGVEAQVSQADDRCELIIGHENRSAREMRIALNTLITLSAEEDYPQLRTLRARFEEIYVHVPDAMIEDDIALVDSPGVHSMSESNAKLTQDIIPHSHLVVCLIDGQSAGSEQDRGFIEMIVKHRRRKVLFVINKSDQLNEDEIDLLGHRGPAKDLFRSLDGIVEAPELFFISSLYALVSRQLADGRIPLDALDENNKIKIPFGMLRELLHSEAPEQAVAAYLIEQSRMAGFRERLLDYLYHENREGAILESICRFLDGQAWRLVRPLDIRLEMARNIPRLAELETICANLTEALRVNKRHVEKAVSSFNAVSNGGELDGVTHSGYAALVERWITAESVEKNVTAPLRLWLEKGENLAKAKRAGYEPLRAEIEGALARFIESVQSDINYEIQSVEEPFMKRLDAMLPDMDAIRPEPIAAEGLQAGAIRASLGGSYIGFALCGGVVLAAAGGAVATLTGAREFVETTISKWPQVSALFENASGLGLPQAALAGALAGAVAGVVVGFIVRAASANGSRRRKLRTAIAEQVRQLVFHGAPSAKSRLTDGIEQRRAGFVNAMQQAFDVVAESIRGKIDTARAEEAAIREKQEEIITRLEPKVESLKAIMESAREIAEANAPKRPAESREPQSSDSDSGLPGADESPEMIGDLGFESELLAGDGVPEGN